VDGSDHDTIDLLEEVGDIDAAVAAEPLGGPPRGRRAGVVELFLVTLANAVWAVVGLVLWLPQAVRAVLGAVLRVVHSALTHQRSDRAVSGIKQVSRLYVERFLRRQSEPVLVGRRHELRPFRAVAETAWVAGFYLLLLRWLAPAVFEPVWRRVVGWASLARAGVEAVGGWLQGLTARATAALDAAALGIGGALLGALLVGALVGFWLGRRWRRPRS